MKIHYITGAAIVMLGIAGCGGDDSALTAGEYRTQAGAICERIDPDITALFISLESKGDTATPEDLQATVDALVQLVNTEIDEIAALTPPDELAADAEAMVAAARTAVSTTEAQGLGFFDDETNPFAEADRMASELGITACAGG
jgi:hypothetical protein